MADQTRFEKIKSKMKQTASAQKERTRRDFKDFLDHPLLFVALIASGFLSALAGVTVGLGAHMQDGNLYMVTDFPHIFFAFLYFILFPYFFEFGLANWLYKFLHREQDNKIQFYTAVSMIGITFIGTAITAFSAMDILVTAGGFFDSFAEIPRSVQRWIAFSLPSMFLVNIVAGELYRQFTTEAMLKRSAEIELREARIATDMEISLARMETEKNISIQAANQYSRRAEAEASVIGKAKGDSDWQSDKNQFQLRGAGAFAKNTNLEDLPTDPKDPAGKRED